MDLVFKDFKESYQDIANLFRNGDYVRATFQTNTLILRVLKEMYAQAIKDMPNDESQVLRALESKVLHEKTIESADLKDMASLFERAKFLLRVKGAASESRLLRAYDLMQVAALSQDCCNQTRNMQSDDLKLSAIWLLDFATLLLKFKGWLSDDIIKSHPTLSKGEVVKQFILDFPLGILKNPEDDQRNVSFKVVTFVNMLGFIFERLLSPENEAVDKMHMHEKLNQYLFAAGNAVGSNFGTALLDKLDLRLSIEQKINQWCDFDTHVGWGKFTNEIKVDNVTHRISGGIKLENNFLVVNRGSEEFGLCRFMSGYIAGVLEKLLKISVEVTHNEELDCAQFVPGKSCCDFYVSNKERRGL